MKYSFLIIVLCTVLGIVSAGEPKAPLGPGPCPKGEKGQKGEPGCDSCPIASVSSGLKTFAGKMEHTVGGSMKTGARKFKHFFTGGKKVEKSKE